MAQIVIRNIDNAVVDALRRRAAASGTSMEEQARRALARAVGLDREAAARRLADVRRSIGRIEGPSVIDASVALKWVIEEDGSEAATALLVGDVLAAPDFVVIECANVLWAKTRRG